MSKAQELKIGSLLRHDTYRIESVLGQGGFGITYLATDLSLERKVAIKEFFPADYCDRDGSTSHVTLGTESASQFVNQLKAKFLKEARNIARFDHPGIIKIHAAFEENNTAYYVMDYIEGGSLSEMVKRNGPLSPDRAIRYLEKIGAALEYVHKHKINHLDIKPANIMIRRSDDSPILIDFGLSKRYDSSGNQTSTTPTGISHGYAPMEQYNAGGVREFSPQTDLYSLAATLYYCLSGVVPPQATTLVDEPLTFPDSIPANLRDAIAKAMSPGRKRRHESISDFLADIKGGTTDEQTHIMPSAHKDTPSIESYIEDGKFNFNNASKDINFFAEPTPKKSSTQKWLIIGLVAVFCAVFLFTFFSGSKSSEPTNVAVSDDSLVTPQVAVIDMEFETPLGRALYTGEVEGDSTDMRPDGEGEAKIVSGEFKGSVYSGQFVNGNMEGPATYTVANGDKFEGTFKNNKYHDGRYTIKQTGDYFVGTFKDGNPDKGTWYNKKGEKI